MYDESVEVVETERKPESGGRFSLTSGRRNIATVDRPSSGFRNSNSNSNELIGNSNPIRQMSSAEEDTEQDIRIGEGQPRPNISRQQPSTARPTTAGRPGTSGTRPGTAGNGNLPISTRHRPPSPEPSEVGGGVSEEDDDEYDEMNSIKIEGPFGKVTPSLFEISDDENSESEITDDSCGFDEYLIDASNFGGLCEDDLLDYDYSDLLNEFPDSPDFFLPSMHENHPGDEESDIDLAKKRWREIILNKKRDVFRKEALYSCKPGVHRAGYRVYNPADYQNLNTSAEIKELFDYITKYSTNANNSRVEVKLRPFIPDYYPSVGDIDAFIKVIHDDVKKDGLGIKVLDEPSAFQSDPSVLDLRLRALAKQSSAKAVVVKKVENVSKNAKIIENWIKDISDLHRSKPSPSVHYSKPMPDVENLLQEWPPEFEELLKSAILPSASMECDLKTYVDLICNLLDIPVYKSRIQSLHLLATLYLTHKNFNTFGQPNSESGMPPSSNPNRMDEVDRLEL